MTLGESDEFGIPVNMFGPIDPELPALVGRIVMLTALLETKLAALSAAIADDPQGAYYGRPPRANVSFCIERLTGLGGSPAEDAWAASATALVERCHSAMKRRNSVVHRVWSKAGRDAWGGWKPAPSGSAHASADWRDWTRESLLQFIHELVALTQDFSLVTSAAASFAQRQDE